MIKKMYLLSVSDTNDFSNKPFWGEQIGKKWNFQKCMLGKKNIKFSP